MDGRSAKELAKAWLKNGNPSMPDEMIALFESSKYTRGMAIEEVHSEMEIPFDDYRNPRNADLGFVGFSDLGKIAVTVEAKSDECYDVMLEQASTDANKAKEKSKASRKNERLFQLIQNLLGVDPEIDFELIKNLRYQLLTATAGWLAYAAEQKAQIAVFVVHVFETSKTENSKLDANAKDFDVFVKQLKKAVPHGGNSGDLFGPYNLIGGDRYSSPVPFLIAKIKSSL